MLHARTLSSRAALPSLLTSPQPSRRSAASRRSLSSSQRCQHHHQLRSRAGTLRPQRLPWQQLSSFAAAAVGSDGIFQPTAYRYKLFKISGDGSCLFRSIVQGAHIASTGSPLSPAQEQREALKLRLAVVELLRKNRSDLEPFLAGIADDFDAYLASMRNPNTWGGEPELLMSANVVQRPINVYRLLRNSCQVVATYGDTFTDKPIDVLWSGAHYDLLLPDSTGVFEGRL